MNDNPPTLLENAAYQLMVRQTEDEVHIQLIDKLMGFSLAEGPYYYSAVLPLEDGVVVRRRLAKPTVTLDDAQLTVRGMLGPLDVVHTLSLPNDRACLEESFTLHNPTTEAVVLEDLVCSFQRAVSDRIGGRVAGWAPPISK